ncbi:MAG: DNA topoisomerase IV subunit A [Burkholderiaceae bacterium]|nr:DNA topoisomerase IV subunit A [Burkholderiaceae bacterium]
MAGKKNSTGSTPDLFDNAGSPRAGGPRDDGSVGGLRDEGSAESSLRASVAIQGLTFDGEHLTLADFAERAYLDYAVSVVKGRALPDLCDGLKPVQRRILYAMHRMSLAVTAKPVKSARVVGDVLGKYHPHGDQSAYDALVRLAQGFSVRYPLIDGQGNFGSRDGDGAAAMRYTEARLTAFASLLLDEIDEGTVDFGPNYDGSFTEPLRLPARLPVALLNGASGIAVGMATEIAPHNVHEVAAAAITMIDKPELSDQELMKLIPGPDFPGGGQIISSADEIAQAYATGKGSLKTRARWSIEEMARGQWQVVVHELPPGVSSQKVLEEIEEITNPKVKAGKKSLSADQQQLKSLMLGVLDTVRDESGKDADVRLVFEPKSSRQDRDEFIKVLLAHTPLESSFAMNLVAVDIDGRPRSLSLREMLSQWVTYRIATVRRRTQHRLEQAQRRIHILEGRAIALLNIDKVIKVIRESDEPKPALIKKFDLTEIQAEDILEIRLRQLARLEAIKIEKELKALREDEGRLMHLLENEKALRKSVAKEIEEDAKKFGDKRRTLIKAAEKTSVEVPVVDEPVTVIVSVNGWVRARQGHGHDAAQFTFKTGDALYDTFECRTVDTLVALSSTGRSYSVAVANLPGARGDGAPLTSMVEVEPGAVLTQFSAGPAATSLVIGTQFGLGFITTIEAMTTRQRAGKQFMTIERGDTPSFIRTLPEAPAHLAMLSAKGRLLVVDIRDVKVLPTGGRGVLLLDPEPKADGFIDAAGLSAKAGLVVCGIGRGGKLAEAVLEAREWKSYVGNRARRGKLLEVKFKPNRLRAG